MMIIMIMHIQSHLICCAQITIFFLFLFLMLLHFFCNLLKQHQFSPSIPTHSNTNTHPSPLPHTHTHTHRSEEIIRSFKSGHVFAAKLYPAGATTNSEFGVSNIEKVYTALQVAY
jgi:dihydroorotase